LDAARRSFGEVGYRRATLRAIARDAGVDPRLVLHYFGSKERLFMETVQLPADPRILIERVFAGGTEAVGLRAAQALVSLLDDPATGTAFTGLIRAAASEPEAAALIREVLTQRVLLPLASRVGGDRPELRAALLGSQVVGLAVARQIVGLAPLTAARSATLVRALAPVVDHYLRGDWTPEGPTDDGTAAAV
jgi:AcrR family transcriptional regulator